MQKSNKWALTPRHYRAATAVGTTMALAMTLAAPRKWAFSIIWGLF